MENKTKNEGKKKNRTGKIGQENEKGQTRDKYLVI
jgi:hypothetical protein